MLSEIVKGLANWLGQLPNMALLVLVVVVAAISFKSKAVLLVLVVVGVVAAVVQWGDTLL